MPGDRWGVCNERMKVLRHRVAIMRHKHAAFLARTQQNLRIFDAGQTGFVCRHEIDGRFQLPNRDNYLEFEICVGKELNFTNEKVPRGIERAYRTVQDSSLVKLCAPLRIWLRPPSDSRQSLFDGPGRM
jgi:hypothetical protein